jgi:hypothetical protein
MIVRVPAAVDSKAERKRADDLVEDHKEDHKEVKEDRRAAAAVLDRDSVIVLCEGEFYNSPLLLCVS